MSHAETCQGDCYEQCDCDRGTFLTCLYRSCYDCYLDRRAEFATCIFCGRWHSWDFPTCFACRAVSPEREDAAKALRQLITMRDEYTCQECGVGDGDEQWNPFRDSYQTALMQVDHIVPCAKRGKADEWNLRLLCSLCNRRKADAWWVGSPWEHVRTSLARKYFLIAPMHFPEETLARFRDEVTAWRATGTWDPTTHATWLRGADA